MKTAYLLFGLAACATTPAPHRPLCDHGGAPACGNIGQAGRATDDAAPSARHAATTFASTVTETTTRVVPALTRVLVGASSQVQRVSPLLRPLVDQRAEVVCGNVMSKGGPQRLCRDANGVRTAIDIENDADASPGQFATP